jgi:adenosylhomocysteinase
VFITATGHPGILTAPFVERVADGAVLANCGHFPWEIDVEALREVSTGATVLDDAIERLELPGGRHVVLIADGRMMNLAGREPKGNSLESMDLGFLLQSLSLERIATATATLTPGAQPVPDDINRTIARRMLAAMGAHI